MKNKIITFAIFLCFIQVLFAQNYSSIKAKEEFDLLNALVVNNYNPCGVSPNADEDIFGEGMCHILDGYITMYKTTGDKAYLYKFIIQSLCMMNNRHDYAGVNSEPHWSEYMYEDGNITGAMARFVYFVLKEDPTLLNVPLYQFDKIQNNFSGQTFNTFGQYAIWLGNRVDETLNWYINNGNWNNSLGFMPYYNSNAASEINKQVGFGRTLLFMGLTDQNTSYQQKATTIANLFKSHITFYDPCEDEFYSDDIFRLTLSNNSYCWYHGGWSLPVRGCGAWTNNPLQYTYYNLVPKYSGFTGLKEDISHGAVVTSLPLDYLNFQPNTPFTSTDMVRFRNMFALNVYDGIGGFNEAVDGTSGPVDPQGQLDYSALNYMPFAKYDGYDNTATTRNVYKIIMDFYSNNIANHNTLPSSSIYSFGQSNRGHSEVVQAQWEKECVNLTLYNRDLVYDQDFIVKNKLVVAPQVNGDILYSPNLDPPIADPKTFTDGASQDRFVIESGTFVNMIAGESVELLPGFEARTGSYFRASVNPSSCTDGRMYVGHSSGSNGNSSPSISMDSPTKIIGQQAKNKNESTNSVALINEISVYPNPFNNSTVVNFTLSNPSTISLIIFDSYGRNIYNQIKERNVESGIYNIPISTVNFACGIYYCKLIVDNKQIFTTKLIKTQ